MINHPNMYKTPTTRSCSFQGHVFCITGTLEGFYFQAYPIIEALFKVHRPEDISVFIKTYISSEDKVTLGDLMKKGLYTWKGQLATKPSKEIFLTSAGLQKLIAWMNSPKANNLYNTIKNYLCIMELELKYQNELIKRQTDPTRQTFLQKIRNWKMRV